MWVIFLALLLGSTGVYARAEKSECLSEKKNAIIQVAFNYKSIKSSTPLSIDSVKSAAGLVSLFRVPKEDNHIVADGVFGSTPVAESDRQLAELLKDFSSELKAKASASKGKNIIFQFNGHGVMCLCNEAKTEGFGHCSAIGPLLDSGVSAMEFGELGSNSKSKVFKSLDGPSSESLFQIDPKSGELVAIPALAKGQSIQHCVNLPIDDRRPGAKVAMVVVPTRDLLEKVEQPSTPTGYAIIDSCFSGGFCRILSANEASRVSSKAPTFVQSGSSVGGVSYGVSGSSILSKVTQHLAQELENGAGCEADMDGDGEIAAREWFVLTGVLDTVGLDIVIRQSSLQSLRLTINQIGDAKLAEGYRDSRASGDSFAKESRACLRRLPKSCPKIEGALMSCSRNVAIVSRFSKIIDSLVDDPRKWLTPTPKEAAKAAPLTGVPGTAKPERDLVLPQKPDKKVDLVGDPLGATRHRAVRQYLESIRGDISRDAKWACGTDEKCKVERENVEASIQKSTEGINTIMKFLEARYPKKF